MTSQQQRRNNNEARRGDSLPAPACQQPDKNTAKACAMQQLAGHQRKPAAALKSTLQAPVPPEAGVPRQDARRHQPHLIRA
jgi:hypothetical protein